MALVACGAAPPATEAAEIKASAGAMLVADTMWEIRALRQALTTPSKE